MPVFRGECKFGLCPIITSINNFVIVAAMEIKGLGAIHVSNNVQMSILGKSLFCCRDPSYLNSPSYFFKLIVIA